MRRNSFKILCLDEIKQTAEKTSLHMKISLPEIKDEAQLIGKLPSMHTAVDWFPALHQPCMGIWTNAQVTQNCTGILSPCLLAFSVFSLI